MLSRSKTSQRSLRSRVNCVQTINRDDEIAEISPRSGVQNERCALFWQNETSRELGIPNWSILQNDFSSTGHYMTLNNCVLIKLRHKKTSRYTDRSACHSFQFCISARTRELSWPETLIAKPLVFSLQQLTLWVRIKLRHKIRHNIYYSGRRPLGHYVHGIALYFYNVPIIVPQQPSFFVSVKSTLL